MSIEKPTTQERQWLAMTQACAKAGVSTSFMIATLERMHTTPTGLATIERETTAADVLATSRSIADNGPSEPGPVTAVRRRRAAPQPPAPKKRSGKPRSAS